MPFLRKYLVIFIAIASLFIAIGCSSSQDIAQSDEDQQTTTTTEPFETPVTYQVWTDISASQLEQLMASKTPPLVLDLRETYLFGNKHIRGAESLPFQHLKGQLGKLDKSKAIVVYDDKEKISKEAARILTDNGFQQVYNLSGGMVTWGGPVGP